MSWLELAKLWLSHGSCKKGNAPYMVLTDGLSLELAQTWTLIANGSRAVASDTVAFDVHS